MMEEFYIILYHSPGAALRLPAAPGVCTGSWMSQKQRKNFPKKGQFLFLIHLFVLVPLCLIRRRSKFFESVLSGEFSWTDEARREVLRWALFLKRKRFLWQKLNSQISLGIHFWSLNRSMLMTASDLGAVTRPWTISKQVSHASLKCNTNVIHTLKTCSQIDLWLIGATFTFTII